MAKYLNIKLTLSVLPPGTPCKYRSRIELSPSGASRGPGEDFDLPNPPEKGYPQFIKTETSGDENRRQIFEKLGCELFGRVFKGHVKAKYEQCCAVAKAKEMKVRLALSILAPELLKVPWEYLHDGYSFLLEKDPEHAIARVIDELQQPTTGVGPFQRLLVVIANPGNKFQSDHHRIKLQSELEKLGVDPLYVQPPTRNNLEEVIRENPFDALYFLGHGRFDVGSGGLLILEKDDGSGDQIEASIIAQWLRNSQSKVGLVYLNSCSTATTDSKNTFAGVAQRLMLDGGITTAVAMQAQIQPEPAMKIAISFFREIRQGKNPEEAMSYARSVADDLGTSGIPVIYGYIEGPEKFERNTIACLLDAEIGKSSFGLSFPGFRMGVSSHKYSDELLQEMSDLASKKMDRDTYVYKGEAFGRTDIMAGSYVLDLLSRITPVSTVQISVCHEYLQPNTTHSFFFGSKSHTRLKYLLGAYRPPLQFEYHDTRLPGKWFIHDTENHLVYSIDDPSQLPPGEYRGRDDYGIIEKIVDRDKRRVFFIVAGLGDRATQGCGWYLREHWEELVAKWVTGPFEVLLRFPGGMGFNHAEWVDRKNNEYGKPLPT